MNLQNIWQHPKTSAAGLLISIVTIAGVLSQQGITLGNAGTGTWVALIAALGTAFLGLLSKDPGAASSTLTKVSVIGLLALGLGVSLTGCPQTSAVAKCSAAAASIGAGLNTAATVNHDMLQAGEETPAEAATVAGYITQAAETNDAFVKSLQALPAQGSTLTDANAVVLFNTLVQQISTLNTEGVLHLKSAKAQQAFATVMTSIEVAAAAVEAVMVVKAAHGGGGLPWQSGVPMLALVLTPEEIEELIALAIAAGSALVAKLESLRGETPAQLQTDALASDAAAEQQAKADQ